MSSSRLPSPITPAAPSAEEVEAFLHANPGFLADRPAIYRALLPPRRLHGDGLADHMAAMIAAERLRRRELEAEVQEAVEAGRAGAGLSVRVRLAVLALMRAQDVMEAITQEMPALLGVESCSLAAEPGRGGDFLALPAGTRRLPVGSVQTLVGRGRDAVVRQQPNEVTLLHAEAAGLVARDALARVPLAKGPPALIALGAREPRALPTRQSVALIAFLGRAVGAALSR